MKLIDLFIAVYLGGMVLWLTYANFGTPVWDRSFFIWEAVFGSSLMTWLCLFTCSHITTKRKVFPLIIFSVFKLIWEIISAAFDWDINNETGVAVLFLIAIVLTTYFSYRPQGFLPKWFIKE